VSGYKFFFTLLALAYVSLSLAQSDSALKELNTIEIRRLFKQSIRQKNAFEAAVYFEHLLKRNKAKDKYFLAYGKSLFESRNYKKALIYLDSAYNIDHEKYYQAVLYKGLCLSQLGEFKKAYELLENSRKEHRKSWNRLETKRLKTSLAGLLKYALKDSIIPIAVKNESALNTPHQEFNPIFGHNQLWVGQVRPKSDSFAVNRSRNYYAVEGIAALGKPFAFPDLADFPVPGHLCFTADSTRYFFTACFYNSARVLECKLFEAKKESKSWKYTLLPAPINQKGVSISHPHWSVNLETEDELIYYAANYPSGKGGKDIWFIEYSNRRQEFKNPRNCGSKVNSAFDENTPVYESSTASLFFSSDGHPGYGGIDIFKVSGRESKWLSEPQPLPLGINSQNDDFAYLPIENQGKAHKQS